MRYLPCPISSTAQAGAFLRASLVAVLPRRVSPTGAKGAPGSGGNYAQDAATFALRDRLLCLVPDVECVLCFADEAGRSAGLLPRQLRRAHQVEMTRAHAATAGLRLAECDHTRFILGPSVSAASVCLRE